jgi:hypothetical protein
MKTPLGWIGRPTHERVDAWDEADERLTVRFAFVVASAALLTALYQTAAWAAG